MSITIPESLIDHDIEGHVVPVEEEKKGYDFSASVGKLQWSGDAVKEQRVLRDEW